MRGIFFIAVFILFALFTPFAAVRFLALLFLLLGVLFYLSTRIARRSVRIERADTLLYVNRFQQFDVKLVVTNRSPFPIHYLTISDNLGGFFSLQPPSFLAGLGPGERRTISYVAEGRERGEYFFGPIVVRGRDAFGLFEWEKTFPTALRVVVYPTVFPLRLDPKKGVPAGNIKAVSKQYEDLTQFRSLREYIPGDELKRINWKASARMGKLFSMEYVPSIYFPVLILLNLTDRDYPLTQKHFAIESAIEIAASLVFFFVGLKQEVGLVTTGKIPGGEEYPLVPVRAGYRHAVSILDILARVKTSDSEANFAQFVLRSGASIPAAAKIMVVTPSLGQEQHNGLMGLKRKGHDVEVFLPSAYIIRRDNAILYGLRSYAVSRETMEILSG